MKIGIIVHSLTGNTLSVAEKLAEQLRKLDHIAVVQQLEVVGGENTSNSKIENISLRNMPEITSYDALVFAGPVRAFSISPVLAKYFSTLTTLNGCRVSLFVTQQLSKPWLGGKHAIKQMKKQCLDLGASVIATGIVNWSNKNRDSQINDVVESLCHSL